MVYAEYTDTVGKINEDNFIFVCLIFEEIIWRYCDIASVVEVCVQKETDYTYFNLRNMGS